MNQTSMKCVNSLCGAIVNNSKQGFTSCFKCSTNFIILCHQFPLTYHKNLKCTKCDNRFYYYPCQKCQNLVINKNHRVGTVTSCKSCKDIGVYLTCGVCYKSFKSDKGTNCEGTSVKCKKCLGSFCYLTCQKCLQPIYSQKPFIFSQPVQCNNMKCRSSQVVKSCGVCAKLYASPLESNAPHFCQQNIPVYQHQSMIQIKHKLLQSAKQQNYKFKPMTNSTRQIQQSISKKNQRTKDADDNCCVVCLDRPKACINTSCFHLNVCEACVPKNNMCPICRTVGEYKKVYI